MYSLLNFGIIHFHVSWSGTDGARAKAIPRNRSLKVPCLLQPGSKPLQGLTGSRGVWWKKMHQIWKKEFQILKQKDNIHQWLFLVPLKGGRLHTTPQKAIYKWYILPSGGLPPFRGTRNNQWIQPQILRFEMFSDTNSVPTISVGTVQELTNG